MKLRSLYQLPAYYLSLLVFAAGGLEVGVVSLLCGWLPASHRVERFFQRYIHYHFGFFHWWCDRFRLVHVRYHGFERLAPQGTVLVANHLSLVDVTCVLARVPEALCIFKPSIRRNPVLGAGARRAGYLANDSGPALVARAARKVAAGHNLLIFPEGTRAPLGQGLLPFKRGFALIARRARAPVQLLRITTDSDLLAKGRSIFALPRFPAHVDIAVGPMIPHDPAASAERVCAEAEAWFRGETGPRVERTYRADLVGAADVPR